MPEKGVLKLNEREVGWEESCPPSIIGEDDDPLIGQFVTHPVCCADPKGSRPTFSLHVSSPLDKNFVQLPVSPPLPAKSGEMSPPPS
ncbi:hypothetical protein B0H10DRAFT_506490 [Mycena sp. CBHHK59/15]|nr:hypothetical protein B0H10DRAFT_506490 [Mycena sp. CBHHK59/15]